MRPRENIEKIIKKFNIDVNPSKDQEMVDELRKVHAKSRQSEYGTSKIDIGRIIMKSKTTKLAAVAVIIITVMIGINQFGGSIDGASVAWAEIVQRVEQSYNNYYAELLSAMEEKDVQKASSNADALSEFWQGINTLAEERLESTQESLSMLRHESFYDPFQEFEQHTFIEYAENFIAWMDRIEDDAWINEIIHVSRQMEEYAEEIRESGRHSELDFSYAEHCLPAFVAYCEWFEQLPWNGPGQVMTPTMLLTRIERDLEIARREIETLETRGVIPFIKRSVQQAQKNVMDVDIRTAASRTKEQRELCRQLTRRIDELCALIIYGEISRQDFLEQVIKQKKYRDYERFDQVLTEEFGNKGTFADYYIKRIDQALSLCDQLYEGFEHTR